MLEPIAQIDDLITIEGYGERVFRVDGWTRADTVNREFEDDYIDYDCHCVVTAEYMIADQDDVKVVCKAADADAYLRTYEMPTFKSMMFGQSIYTEGESGMFNAHKPKQVIVAPKPKALTEQERIDALLDERNTVGTSDDFVTVADPEAYKQRRCDEIDAQLEELRAE